MNLMRKKISRMLRSSARRMRTVLPMLLAASLASCAARQLPPPVVTGSALALPAVGNTTPVYVYLSASAASPQTSSPPAGANVFYVSVDHEEIFGITPSGERFSAFSVDEAANSAGGYDSLLARLSDEGQIEHVVKKSGLTLGAFTVGGLALGCQAITYVPGAIGLIPCAAGGALGAAAGLVGAVGVGGYLAVSEHARKADMVESVSLPGSGGTPLKGYVFLQAATYKTLKISVKDQTGEAQEIEIAVVGGTLESPGLAPVASVKSP